METISQGGRESIRMKKYSEKFIRTVSMFFESSSDTQVDISTRRDDDIDCFEASVECETIWKIFEVNLVEPCTG